MPPTCCGFAIRFSDGTSAFVAHRVDQHRLDAEGADVLGSRLDQQPQAGVEEADRQVDDEERLRGSSPARGRRTWSAGGRSGTRPRSTTSARCVRRRRSTSCFVTSGRRQRPPRTEPRGNATHPRGRPCPGHAWAKVEARAPVAQGIERSPPERKVAGSIPAGRILRRCRESPIWLNHAAPLAPRRAQARDGAAETRPETEFEK